jgi:NAD(P)H-dependent flavin oxidoreductase YrpB (nitropropane dioxygenase family)
MAALGLPSIIQGGMGAAVSSWGLAKEVAMCGQLGVVSGTALESVVARRLQDGDVGGHMREALKHFPYPVVTEHILEKWFLPEGRNGQPYRPMRRISLNAHTEHDQLVVAANFVEVWLAKQANNGKVGINFLEKLQTATPAALYGAMLAGVDAVLMGAGIPREIPKIIRDFAEGKAGTLSVDSERPSGMDAPTLTFDPLESFGAAPKLKRPMFLAIITAEVLASYLARNDVTKPDGFIVEHWKAGGHNAPPRRKVETESGFGPLDEVNFEKMKAVGLPFWFICTCNDHFISAVGKCSAQGCSNTKFKFCFSRDFERCALDMICINTQSRRQLTRNYGKGYTCAVVKIILIRHWQLKIQRSTFGNSAKTVITLFGPYF